MQHHACVPLIVCNITRVCHYVCANFCAVMWKIVSTVKGYCAVCVQYYGDCDSASLWCHSVLPHFVGDSASLWCRFCLNVKMILPRCFGDIKLFGNGLNLITPTKVSPAFIISIHFPPSRKSISPHSYYTFQRFLITN